MKDALNCEIEIGNTYGYSTNKNGYTTVTFGKVLKTTEKRVILTPIMISTSLYEDDLSPINSEDHPKTIKVRGNRLFPVKEEDIP